MVLEKRKKDLIEKLGVYIEVERKVPPIAARILATLIINGCKGTTFDQLVTDLEASKSTISTHLSNLELQNSIIYFTKCGDRKRYYTIKPGYITRKIRSLSEQWSREIELQKEIISYKNDFNRAQHKDENHLPVAFHEQSLHFLESTLEYLEKQLIIFQNIEK